MQVEFEARQTSLNPPTTTTPRKSTTDIHLIIITIELPHVTLCSVSSSCKFDLTADCWKGKKANFHNAIYAKIIYDSFDSLFASCHKLA